MTMQTGSFSVEQLTPITQSGYFYCKTDSQKEPIFMTTFRVDGCRCYQVQFISGGIVDFTPCIRIVGKNPVVSFIKSKAEQSAKPNLDKSRVEQQLIRIERVKKTTQNVINLMPFTSTSRETLSKETLSKETQTCGATKVDACTQTESEVLTFDELQQREQAYEAKKKELNKMQAQLRELAASIVEKENELKKKEEELIKANSALVEERDQFAEEKVKAQLQQRILELGKQNFEQEKAAFNKQQK
ncbi:MAG: hypothetical protein ACPGUD_04485 [Parashewanella sp.]